MSTGETKVTAVTSGAEVTNLAVCPTASTSRGGPVFRQAPGASRTWRALLCALAVTTSLVFASLMSAADPARATPRPPNPTDAQLDAARTAKASLAHTVGVLSGQLVQAQAQLRSLNAKVQLAEQR